LQSVCNDSTDSDSTDCSLFATIPLIDSTLIAVISGINQWNQSVESAVISGINQWNLNFLDLFLQSSVESISGINQWNLQSISGIGVGYPEPRRVAIRHYSPKFPGPMSYSPVFPDPPPHPGPGSGTRARTRMFYSPVVPRLDLNPFTPMSYSYSFSRPPPPLKPVFPFSEACLFTGGTMSCSG